MPILSTTEDLSKLTDIQLTELVRAAAEVLLDGAPDDVDPETLTMSPREAAQQVTPYLESDDSLATGKLQNLLEDTQSARQINIKILEELRASPELSQRIDERYDRGRQNLMTETVLLTGALVVLAVRLKEIAWHGGKITFFKSSSEVKAFLTKLLGLAT
jgi:hypothetical protein